MSSLKLKKHALLFVLIYIFAKFLFISCATISVKKQLKEHGFEGVNVESDDDGVLIRLEEGDILFGKDSSLITLNEKEKLQKIANILKLFRNQEIMIKGYTAHRGTKEGRQIVSEMRARAIANYLVKAGIKKRDQIFIKSYGARNPAATNKTEEGRALNRRAEIVVLNKGFKTIVQTEIEHEGIRHLQALAGTNGTLIRAGRFDTRFGKESFYLADCELIKLDKLAQAIELFESHSILIKGHAALYGTRGKQWALSVKRANAVANYFIKYGIKSPEQIIIQSYGADDPIASNKTEEGKALNRRVEVIILDADYHQEQELEDDVDIYEDDDEYSKFEIEEDEY